MPLSSREINGTFHGLDVECRVLLSRFAINRSPFRCPIRITSSTIRANIFTHFLSGCQAKGLCLIMNLSRVFSDLLKMVAQLPRLNSKNSTCYYRRYTIWKMPGKQSSEIGTLLPDKETLYKNEEGTKSRDVTHSIILLVLLFGSS